MNRVVLKALLFSAISAALIYSAYFNIEYYQRVGVSLASPIGFTLIVCIVTVIISFGIGLPIYLLLSYLKLDKPIFYLILGCLIGAFVSGGANLEGFCAGLVAALVFNLYRANNRNLTS
jgi:hypothetical protein